MTSKINKLQLLDLLEDVLGKSKKTSGDNFSFYCPNCHHKKRKLEINLSNQKWQCWVCKFKGRKIWHLFKYLNVSKQHFDLLKSITKDVLYSKEEEQKFKSESIFLPEDYLPLCKEKNDPEYRNAMHYIMKKRKLTKEDIIKYKIGYCSEGEYKGMIIVPSYNEKGALNYFTARNYYEEGIKHKNPKFHKNIVGFELFINWNEPIILVEGVFDAMTVKRNAIPLYGKVMLENLKLKIVKNNVKKVYIALDEDALGDAIDIAEYLMKNGIIVYLIEMKDGDPSEIGFEKMTELIKNAKSLNFSKLIELKLYKGIS